MSSFYRALISVMLYPTRKNRTTTTCGQSVPNLARALFIANLTMELLMSQYHCKGTICHYNQMSVHTYEDFLSFETESTRHLVQHNDE